MNFINKVKSFFFGGESSDSDAEQQQQPSTTQPPAQTRSGARPHPGAASNRPGAAAGHRQRQPEPVLREAGYSQNGGVQGLTWYAAGMVKDQHGDFAHEFLDEETAAATSQDGVGAAGPAAPAQAPAGHGSRSNGTVAAGPATVGTAAKDARAKVEVQGLASRPLRVKAVEQGTVVVEPA